MLSLTERDREILETLTRKIRYLSEAQIARTWWADSRHSLANTRARMKLLEEAGYVSRFVVVTHPEIEISSPVEVWFPGEASPNFGAASWKLQSRWDQPPTTVSAVIATKRAGHLFGGSGGRYPRPSEQTHDLHLSGLYLRFLRERAEEARTWRSEELLRPEFRNAEKLPDAMVGNGASQLIIEFGGAYKKEKLAKFHHFCAYNSLAYELW